MKTPEETVTKNPKTFSLKKRIFLSLKKFRFLEIKEVFSEWIFLFFELEKLLPEI